MGRHSEALMEDDRGNSGLNGLENELSLGVSGTALLSQDFYSMYLLLLCLCAVVAVW